MVDEPRRPSSWWLGSVVAIVIILASNFGGVFIGGAVLGAPAQTDVRHQYGEVFSFGLILIFVWVVLKEGRSFGTVGFRPGRDWRLPSPGVLDRRGDDGWRWACLSVW
jgi:hypothetical protein